MPNNNPGNNLSGWSVNASGNSGGVGRGIMGAAINALGRARRTQQNLYEFDYKENAKRETYIQRKAADQAGHVMKIKANKTVVSDMARRHGKTTDADGNSTDRPNFNYNAATGAMSYSVPSTYTEDMLKLGKINQETERLKNERASGKAETASEAEPTNGTKKERSTKKAEAAANAGDAWAATAPSTPTPSRTTSNITPPTQTTPKSRKPRAPRAPKNPGQSGGMQ